MHTYSLFNILVIFEICWDFSNCLSLSLPLLSFTLVVSMAPKRKSAPSRNPLCFGASTSSDPTPSHIWFCDEDARKAFSENFSRQSIHFERRVILADFANTDLPDVIHNQGWESLYDVLVTCLSVLIQEFYFNMHGPDSLVSLFHTRVRGTRIVVTLKLVSDVLCVPRVEFPDYLGCERLRTVSKDELKYAFCERPSVWGECQFTYCLDFGKGPQFFNMVMTFVLHPLSHYNSITEPCAQFLLSLLKHLIINFPSHFILSILDVYRDSASRDKLIFPLVITRILHHFSYMSAIDYATVKRSKV